VFEVGTNGVGFLERYSFGAPFDAQGPKAPLIQGFDGVLYGTTVAGGASAIGGASGYGTIFKINPDGTGEAVLHSFLPTDGDGQRPYGALVQGSDGTLYGVTSEGGSTAHGGSSGGGTIFKINPDGSGYSILHSFDPALPEGNIRGQAWSSATTARCTAPHSTVGPITLACSSGLTRTAPVTQFFTLLARAQVTAVTPSRRSSGQRTAAYSAQLLSAAT
jgi:uncharacterized repeat protein (TIGR03803 family)